MTKEYLTIRRISYDRSLLRSHPPHSTTTVGELQGLTCAVKQFCQSRPMHLMKMVEGACSEPPFLFLDAQQIDVLLELLPFLMVFPRYALYSIRHSHLTRTRCQVTIIRFQPSRKEHYRHLGKRAKPVLRLFPVLA
jgi:hypothetical protein